MTRKNGTLFKSFKAAWKGFKDVLVFENTFRKMLLIATVVIALMFYFQTTTKDTALLLIMIFAVLTLELINSVVERIMDFIHIEGHEKVGEIKDLMAAIVLLVSISALIIGGIIFWPYIFG